MVESWIDAMRDGERSVRAQLGSIYVERFCRALAQNQSVTSLDLEGSGIDCRGMTSLSSALAQHPTLTRLSLFRNRIGDDGCIQLADVLAKRPPPRLLYLDLRFNALTEKGISHLSRMLEDNYSLTSIDIHASARSASYEAILRICERNQRRHSARQARTLLALLRSSTGTSDTVWPEDILLNIVTFVEPVDSQLQPRRDI